MKYQTNRLTQAICYYMAKNRISQREMAKLIGVSSAALSNWLTKENPVIRTTHATQIELVCGQFLEPTAPSSPTATASATPSTATATASAGSSGIPIHDTPERALSAYRETVITAIMADGSIDLSVRAKVCAIIANVPAK